MVCNTIRCNEGISRAYILKISNRREVLELKMSSFVIRHVVASCEFLRAVGALEGFFTSVRSYMDFHVSFLLELFSALFTGVGSMSFLRLLRRFFFVRTFKFPNFLEFLGRI